MPCNHTLHINNIERELEVMKNCLYQLITDDAITARNAGNLVAAQRFMELREYLDLIFPTKIEGIKI